MQRTSDRSVKLTEQELLVKEIHTHLMDQGLTQVGALAVLRGSRGFGGTCSESPALDAVLTPEFAAWLAS